MSQSKNPSKTVCILALFIAAFFWGTTFVAQSIGARTVPPFTFLAGRSLIGTLFLLPIIGIRSRISKSKESLPVSPDRVRADRRLHLKAGAISGFFLFAASFSQQTGIAYTTTAKASFITTLYVVLVPIFSLLIKKKPAARVWVAVAFSVSGLYFLSINGEFRIALGDGLVMLCAVLFALQIMSVNHFNDRTDALRLSCSMFFFEAIFASISMLIFEDPCLSDVLAGLPAILYAGILSNGVAFTAQVIGQKGVNPSVASLIMCLESVFGALSGWVVLHEGLSARELLGCGLMFLAVLIAEIKLPIRKGRASKEN